jgi:hypothetical protein
VAETVFPVPESEQQLETALRAANLALGGRKHHEFNRFASVELRLTDPRVGAWEIAALTAVAVASALVVVGLWFW